VETETQLPILPVIVGPTASGKSALAMRLAESFGRAEIVSCDSVAVFREFEIGTAKPSREDRAKVRHHLIDVVGPVAVFTAGDYARLARQALADVSARGAVPIVAGGTGLYLRALLQGLFVGPARSEELRTRLRLLAEERGHEYLHRVLKRLDATSAGAIHANDQAKVIRAIEVCLASRTKITELWKNKAEPLRGYRAIRIGLQPERQLLYERINQRCAKMWQDGLAEETRGLLEKYPELQSDQERLRQSPFISLGYRQAVQYIRGEITNEEALGSMQQAHRNYAKRQMTWFRREPDVHWLAAFGGEARTVATAKSLFASVPKF
jgi:tRNA dimethylallyltransferase